MSEWKRTLWAVAAAAACSAAGAGAQPGGPGRGGRVTPVVEAYRKASPAVVNISTERLVRTGWRMFGNEDDPFESFMGRLFGRAVPAVSLGSGFFLHGGGYIVTNAHVVRRAEKITVSLPDKSSFAAVVVAANTAEDLAVLKVTAAGERKFQFLRLGRSNDLMIGETVIAIGNPFGYQNTCTTGVISALRRKLEFKGGVTYSGLIQTDAPINPGNSGGPLLNIRGELIAVNTAIRADAQGIGFAIPVGRLVADLPRLLDFERLNRAVFGLRVEQRRGKAGDELVVASVAPGSPAQRAGCRSGDRLVELNGRGLVQLPDFQIPMLEAKPPAKVALTCLRGGRRVRLTVPVEARPRPDGAALAEALLGLTVRQITPDLARKLRLPVPTGLLVTAAQRGGPADRIGIRRNDIVFQLGRWYVTDTDTLGAILEDVRPGDGLRIGIIRGRVRAWAQIQARKGPPSKATTRPKDRLRI